MFRFSLVNDELGREDFRLDDDQPMDLKMKSRKEERFLHETKTSIVPIVRMMNEIPIDEENLVLESMN